MIRFTASFLIVLGACGSKGDAPPKPDDKPVVVAIAPVIYGAANPAKAIDRLALAHDGSAVVALARDGTLARLELKPKTYAALPAAPDGVKDVALSADGKQLAIAAGGALTIAGAAVALPKAREALRVAFAVETGDVVVLAIGDEGQESDAMHLLALDAAKHFAVKTDARVGYSSRSEDCELALGARGDLAVLGSCSASRAVRVRDGVELANWTVSGIGSVFGIAEPAPGQFAVGHAVGEDEPELELQLPGDERGLRIPGAGPCALAPSARLVACDGEGNAIVVRDTSAKHAVRARVALPEFASRLAFTADGTTLVAGLQDGRLAVIDVAPVLAGAPPLVVAPAVQTLSAQVAVLADAPLRKVKPARTIAMDAAPLGIAPSPDRKSLAVMTSDGVAIVDLASGKRRSLVEGTYHLKGPEVAWSPDGAALAEVESDDEDHIRIYATTGGDTAAPRELGRDLKEPRVAWSPNGERIATGGKAYGTIAVFDAKSGSRLRDIEPVDKQWLGGLAFAPDGKLLAWGDWTATSLWDVETGKLAGALRGHASSIVGAAWSPDGTQLATIGRDGAVILWDAKTLAPKSALRGFELPLAIAWSPDGTELALSHAMLTGLISIWRVADGKPLVQLQTELRRSDVFAWIGGSLVVGLDRELGVLTVPKL